MKEKLQNYSRFSAAETSGYVGFRAQYVDWIFLTLQDMTQLYSKFVKVEKHHNQLYVLENIQLYRIIHTRVTLEEKLNWWTYWNSGLLGFFCCKMGTNRFDTELLESSLVGSKFPFCSLCCSKLEESEVQWTWTCHPGAATRFSGPHGSCTSCKLDSTFFAGRPWLEQRPDPHGCWGYDRVGANGLQRCQAWSPRVLTPSFPSLYYHPCVTVLCLPPFLLYITFCHISRLLYLSHLSSWSLLTFFYSPFFHIYIHSWFSFTLMLIFCLHPSTSTTLGSSILCLPF